MHSCTGSRTIVKLCLYVLHIEMGSQIVKLVCLYLTVTCTMTMLDFE
jgi:hypothetical protein